MGFSMKRYGNIFSQIYHFGTLYKAYNNARKGRRYRREILTFGYHLEKNLLCLQNELRNKTYKHGQYRNFVIHDAKKREIKAASFKDRVVHKAFYDTLEPLFDKSFIYDSYACRTNKGLYKAIGRLEGFINNSRNKYYLQCDISKYFKSIDHEVLLSLVEKKIKDPCVLWLVSEIVNSYSETVDGKKGIPIGNLTSQLFANIYLNDLDQFIKHNLGRKSYIRYMDDFLILGKEKKELRKALVEIKYFLGDKLKLMLHPSKILLAPLNKGVDFLGYRVFKEYKLLRKITVKRFIKRTKKQMADIEKGKVSIHDLNNSLQAFIAYAKHGNSWRLRKNISEKFK
jgi:RNA-directed DNA polymerase